MKSYRHRLGNACVILGLILVGCALGLVLWNLRETYRAGRDSDKILSELAPIITQSENGAAPDKQAAETVGQIDYEMPAEEIDGRWYIGVLVIPDLDLEVPIQEDWDYPGLQVSPCRYYGAAVTRNLVICAHNYSTHFGRLKELTNGADVHLVTMKGTVLNYKVAMVETLQPTDVFEMKQSDYDLTLFTCTIGGATRVTVRCNMN